MKAPYGFIAIVKEQDGKLIVTEVKELVTCEECIHRHMNWSCAGNRNDFYCAYGKKASYDKKEAGMEED